MNGKAEEVWIETVNGVRVRVRAVAEVLLAMAEAAVERDFRSRGEPVDPPTYTVETVGGGTDVFAHDEQTLDVTPAQTGIADPGAAEKEAEERSRANWRAWEEHKQAQARLRSAKTDRRMQAWFTGLEVEVPDDGWERRQKALGIEVPEDPDERRHHYITTELLTTAADLFGALEACSKLTYRGMVKEGDIAAAIDSFRNQMEGAAAAAAGRQGDGVELRDGTGSAEGGEGLGGDAPEPVQGAAIRGQGGDHRRRARRKPDAGPRAAGSREAGQQGAKRPAAKKAGPAAAPAEPKAKVRPDA